jgi:hypothetical protein
MNRRAEVARRSQLLALNSFFPFMVLFFLGWALIGRLIPPPSPGLDAEDLTHFFMAHRERYLVCMQLSMLSTAFLMPFSAVIVGQIARIEAEGPRVWTYAALMAAAGNVVSFTFPLMFFCVALFRPERDPALVQLASDLGWLPFLAMASPYITLPICVAIAGLIDLSPDPVFPRWFCYLTIASTIAILPACMIPFFHEPAWFAWNSMFGWWVPFSDVFGWMLLTYWFCRRGILAQARAAGAA